MRFINDDGIARVRVITPGQGSSAYYEEEQIERDGTAFSGGLVFIDHPGRQESKDRPERSLRDLVGPVVGMPAYDRNCAKPGLYSEVKVASHWRPFLEELGSDIGVSIRASGSAVMKTIEGKRTKVAEKFNPGAGFDFVTKAGRGGKLIPLMESALSEADGRVANWMKESTFVEGDGRSEEERFIEWMDSANVNNEGDGMELQEAQAKLTEATGQVTTLTSEKATLTEANVELEKENARLAEALALRDAGVIIVEALADPKLKFADVSVARLTENLTKGAPIKEGKLDEAALKVAISEAVTEEQAYIEGLPHAKPGIRGMGEGGSDGDAREKLIETKKADYRRQGKTAEEAERMARLFAEGR